MELGYFLLANSANSRIASRTEVDLLVAVAVHLGETIVALCTIVIHTVLCFAEESLINFARVSTSCATLLLEQFSLWLDVVNHILRITML